jgi:phenylalanyl-tRNA synthetase beta chain
VIEEILRIYGYNNIDISKNLNASLTFSEKPEREKIRNLISDLLSSSGFLEIMSNSLTKSSYYEDETGVNKKLVRIFNPLSSDLNCMRQTLLYGGLEAIIYNTNHKNPNLRMYEFGNIYLNTGKVSENPLEKYFEEERLTLFLTGEKNEANWNTPAGLTNFYQIKSYTEFILKRLGFDLEKMEAKSTSDPNISEGLDYSLKGNLLVSFGRVNKRLILDFDIKNEVYYADFHWNRILIEISTHKISYSELPKYPEVRRDLSMVLEKSVKFEQLKNISLKAEKKLLKSIVLFDVYEGDKIEAGKKSYAVSYTIRDDTKTLTDKQIDKIMNSISHSLETELGAQIRSLK